MGKIQRGLTKVSITENNTTKELSNKNDIENACHDENFAKFSQTNNTPPMKPPLSTLLGYLGISPACQAILNGTFTPPPDTDIYTREFLQHLKAPKQLLNPPIASISAKDFQEGWSKMKERTSSGISGIHFGHMKACATSPWLSTLEATLAHIPYSTGLSPEKWKKSINVMLEKKRKGNHVSKLRTICLLEADFNFNNKKIGRDILRCAEHNNLLPREQYGS